METIEQKYWRISSAVLEEMFPGAEPLAIDSSEVDQVSLKLHQRTMEIAIAEEREANGWQPIETAPKDGTCILALVPDSDVAKVLAWCDEPKNNPHKDTLGVGWRMVWDSYFFRDHEQPTLWIPHPAAPKDEVSKDA